MSEAPTPGVSSAAPPVAAAEANGQLIVSLAIVSVLGVLGVGLIIAGCLTGGWATLGTGIGTTIGALANALTAPTGVANAIRAAKPPAP